MTIEQLADEFEIESQEYREENPDWEDDTTTGTLPEDVA